MQAFTVNNEPIGDPIEVPIEVPKDSKDFKKKLTELLKQENADNIKIFIEASELKDMSPTQKLLFELKNKKKIKVKY